MVTFGKSPMVMNGLKINSHKHTHTHRIIIMRKIEAQMCKAIHDCESFKSANTRVDIVDGEAHVYLHNNWIARIRYCSDGQPFYVTVNNCGWASPTTKSRLNAMLRVFTKGRIYQKNHVWYCYDVSIDNSLVEFPSNEWVSFSSR